MTILEVLKMISDKNRIRVLNLLYHNDTMCVCVLEETLEINQSNLSRHLTKMKKAGLIIGHKRAQWVDYSISKSFLRMNPFVEDILKYKMNEDIYQQDLCKVKCTSCG